jgi:flagella basal body P-ring formation protein FlgA
MRKLPLVALTLCLGTIDTQAATLRPMTTLHSSTVKLSDLFDDAGTNANKALGPGPGVGGRIVVESAQLAAIAHQFRVDWQPASTADRAVLDRPGRPLRRDVVVRALRNALETNGVSSDCDIELAEFTTPMVPMESDPRSVVSDLSYDAGAGRFTAVLSISGDGMEPIDMRLAGRVDDTVELPVATSRLPAGTVLRAEDVHVVRVHTSLVHGEVVRRTDDAVGLQLRHQLSAGFPLAVGELTRPAIVQKGATVMMLLDSPGIALTAQGQALEAGSIGERIRVLNPASHAVIEVEVMGPDRVRVAPNATPLKRPTNVSMR